VTTASWPRAPSLELSASAARESDYREAPTRLAVGLVVRLPPARRSLRIGCTRSPAGWWPGTEDSAFPFIPRQLDARRRLALFSASTSRSTCFTIALSPPSGDTSVCRASLPAPGCWISDDGLFGWSPGYGSGGWGSNPSRRGKPAAQRRCRKGLTATRSWRHHRY
jgi:hypothetical protein